MTNQNQHETLKGHTQKKKITIRNGCSYFHHSFSGPLFVLEKCFLFRNNFNVVTFNLYIYSKRNLHNLHQECNKLNNTFKQTGFVVVARVNTLFQTSNCRLFYKREKLLTLHEHLDSPLVFGGVRVAQPFSFLCSVLQIVVRPFVLFSWPLIGQTFFDLRISVNPLVTSNSSYLISTNPTLS